MIEFVVYFVMEVVVKFVMKSEMELDDDDNTIWTVLEVV